MPQAAVQQIIPYSPGQIIGGHTPGAIDRRSVAATLGLFPVAQNLAPAALGNGLTKRPPVLYAGEYSATLRIVNHAYAAAQRIVSGVQRGAFWDQKDEATTLTAMIRPLEYNEEASARYAAAGLQSELTPTFWPNSIGALEPGTGLWRASVLSHVYAAGGKIVRKFDAGGPVPMKLMWVSRLGDIPHYNGLFFLPNAAEGAREVDIEGYQVLPEKPWTSLGGIWGWTVNRLRVADPRTGHSDLYAYSGDNYWGYYEYLLLPIDENGEVGPPIAKASKTLDRYQIVGDTRRMRGISFIHEIENVASASIRANIHGLILWGRYTNPNPVAAYWTTSVLSGGIIPGGGHPFTMPVDAEGIITIINLNGRQFDPRPNELIPQGQFGASAQATTLQPSDRFNRFKTAGDEEGWIADVTKNSATALVLFTNANSMRWTQFATDLSSNTQKVFVEIEGFAGVWRVTAYTLVGTGADADRVDLTVTGDLPTAWVTGTTKRIRFCFPWVFDDPNYRIQVWDAGPLHWDTSYKLPFTEEATADDPVGYPYYFGHCENPSGTRRLAWDASVTVYDNSGTLTIQDEPSLLFYTTNDLNGFLYRCRFALTHDFEAKITGAAFLTDEAFIVTTREWAQFCEFVYEDDQWIVKPGRRLEYGNAGRALVSYNETVYGIDAKYGPWALGIDAERFRSDIAPVSGQFAMMNGLQVDWFRETYGGSYDRLHEAQLVVTPQRVLLTLPVINTAGSAGEAKYNIDRYPATSAAAHVWLTFWPGFGAGFWSFDMMLQGAAYLPLFDPIVGPHGQIYAHTQESSLGDLFVFADDWQDGIVDQDEDSNYPVIRAALEMDMPCPDGWPVASYQLARLFARISAQGTAVSYTHTVTAAEEAAEALTLHHTPRTGMPVKITLNGSTQLDITDDYTVSGRTLDWSIYGGTMPRENDTLLIEYYPQLSYDLDITAELNGDAGSPISSDGNLREGWINPSTQVVAEAVRLRITDVSPAVTWLKALHLFWSDAGAYAGVAATEAVDPVNQFYGIADSTLPITT